MKIAVVIAGLLGGLLLHPLGWGSYIVITVGSCILFLRYNGWRNHQVWCWMFLYVPPALVGWLLGFLFFSS